MRSPYLIILCVVTMGCATQNETFLPDGAKGYNVDCSGGSLNWGKCYEKAGEICGARGYEIIAGGAESGGVVTGGQFGLFGGTTMSRNMLIKCKN